MGLYYNPNPPFIGAPQPLAEVQLTPPSGPLPQNPPFRGSRVSGEILNCWAAAVVVAALTAVLPPLLVPQPAAATPLFKKQNFEIYRAWDASVPAPITAINLDPPISGPAPQNPPVVGSYIPTAVQVAWLPLPPAPIVAVNLNPPISGPAANNPLFAGTRVPIEIQVAWLPPAPAPITAVNLDPPQSGPAVNNPPLAAPRTVLWPADITLPYDLLVRRLLIPAAPGAAVNLPIGARVPQAVLSAWLAPPQAPVVSVLLNPLIAGPAPHVADWLVRARRRMRR